MRTRFGLSCAVAGVIALGVAAGCEPNKYCLDCYGDGGAPSPDGNGGDGGSGGNMNGDGGATIDGGPCVPTGPETCNGADDDCDGTVDDSPAQVGDVCNAGLPVPCTQGVFECTAGALRCGGGAVNPSAESCNGLDDDCDGTADDGDPGAGMLCGSDLGDCLRGVTACTGGAIVCQGEIGPTPELCDGHDNDCDGMVDDGDPEGGMACGIGMGTCAPGTIHCVGGGLLCQGAGIPTLEVCNLADDDCDGLIDEDFPPATDPNNCGGCGIACTAIDGLAQCNGGSCEIAFCFTDYWDDDLDYTTGCEYFCPYAGSEICNGADDDCDNEIDEGLTPPAICATLGACAGTVATCDPVDGWTCTYGATVSQDATGAIIPENDCDGSDNDCDGPIDEAFPLEGSACDNGLLGICRGTGTRVCNGTMDGLTCDITSPGAAATTEICDGIDQNCNGTPDDGAPDRWIRITGAFGTKWIYQFEASRPDATGASAGTMTHRACSAPGRLPWTNITHDAAQTQCANAGGRLCTEAEWQRACQTTAATACQWSYDTSCTTYAGATCNGNDYDFVPGGMVNEDGLLATSSLATCDANWTAGECGDGTCAGGETNATCAVDCAATCGSGGCTGAETCTSCPGDCGACAGCGDGLCASGESCASCPADCGGCKIFDMSGNVKEWTAERLPATTPPSNPLRGGAYNNTQVGISCGFNFVLADDAFQFENAGFRCCRDSAP